MTIKSNIRPPPGQRARTLEMKQYKVMLATEAEAPFSSADWIFEIKWDGIRAISYIDHKLSIRSRSGRELSDKFPEFKELRKLAVNAILDGEIIVMKEGKVDFQAVSSRNLAETKREIEYLARMFPATYVVFDILEKDGESLTDKPLTERKEILKENLKEGRYVVISTYIEEKGEGYYQAAIKRGLEGLIAKRKQSPYKPGRSRNWLKIKRVRTCDCVIFGYTRGKGRRENTFGALILGLYRDGKPLYVGKVGTGFTQENLENLKQLFRELKVGEKTIEGVDIPQEVTWIEPSLVCEVGYHSITREGLLRMPRFLGLRGDKRPRDCTMDQIEQDRLGEYASKRDFSMTPEPEGGETKSSGRSFVIQEHHSRRLHYDMRLERDGVLKSWAVPKGPPEKRGEKKLAIETEDHPMEYMNFEGTIPEGEYGAGVGKIWDRGLYEPLIWQGDKIEFILLGSRLKGRYVLVRFKKAGEKEWLFIKVED